MFALLILATGCSALSELRRELRGQPWEQNLTIRFENNLPILPSARIEGASGRFAVATALPATVLDRDFARRHSLEDRLDVTVSFREVESSVIRPEILEMPGLVDGMIGSDALGPVLIIDYRRRLLTRSRKLVVDDARETYLWEGIPSLPITLNGERMSGIVDTMNPDTIHVPATSLGVMPGSRVPVVLTIGHTSLGQVEALATPGDVIRLGNVVLENLAIGIDYESGQIALWPR